MATLQGSVSIVWGCAISGISYTGSGSMTSQSESWSEESDEVIIKNASGETVGIYYYNYRQKVSLNVFPSGSTAKKLILHALIDPGFGGSIFMLKNFLRSSFCLSPTKSYIFHSNSQSFGDVFFSLNYF